MSYTFVLRDKGTKGQGWWLKISDIDQLKEYHESVFKHIMEDGLNSYNNSVEFRNGNRHANTLGVIIGQQNKWFGFTPVQTINNISKDTLQAQIQALKDGCDIYINRRGGWCFGHHDYADWCHRDTIEFPRFKKDQIRVERFPMGNHYYAYIDDIQVRDGDKFKWNSYDEAYSYASSLVDNKGV